MTELIERRARRTAWWTVEGGCVSSMQESDGCGCLPFSPASEGRTERATQQVKRATKQRPGWGCSGNRTEAMDRSAPDQVQRANESYAAPPKKAPRMQSSGRLFTVAPETASYGGGRQAGLGASFARVLW